MSIEVGLSACEHLVHAFAWHVDHHESRQAADLFALHAVFERRGEALQGQDAIHAAFLKRPASVTTRHLCSNLLLTVESPTRILGRSYFTLYRHDGGGRDVGQKVADEATPRPLELPEFVGEYQDVFELTEQGWRIAHRRAHAVFQRAP